MWSPNGSDEVDDRTTVRPRIDPVRAFEDAAGDPWASGPAGSALAPPPPVVAAVSWSAWDQPATPDVALDQALPLAGPGPVVPRDLAERPPAVARAGYGYPDGRGLQDHARATPGSRFAAILVDSLVFTGGYVVVALILSQAFTAGLALVLPLTLLVAVVAYQIVLNGRGQTLGKRVMKIAVVDVNTGAPIGPGRSAVRLLMMNVMGIPCYFGYLSVLGEGYRGWHDRAADSIVVKV